MNAKVGDTITITYMEGEDLSKRKTTGVITHIDDMGQLHGTWGGLAVIPGTDKFIIH